MVVFPVSADIRRARSALARGMRPVLGRARGPVLIALGVGEAAGGLARSSLSRTPVNSDRTAATSELSAPPTGGELRERGELAWEQLLDRPEAVDLISRGALLAATLAQWLEDTTDEMHDRSEELLARLDNAFPHRHRR